MARAEIEKDGEMAQPDELEPDELEPDEPSRTEEPADALLPAELDDEPPDALLCPITYSLYRDPVCCVADGRVYERDGLVGFWRHRPLAGFFGGAQHASAAMVPAIVMREQVETWLDEHPSTVPEGWATRDPGPPSTQAQLDRLASEIERLALARAAAAAAAQGGDAAVEQVRALCAPSVRLIGRMPGGRRSEYLGIFDRCDDADANLYAGRHAYVLRRSRAGPHQPMLWFANNGFWHAGERQYLGQQTGWLIVADDAAVMTPLRAARSP